jgi:hypothetical protein
MRDNVSSLRVENPKDVGAQRAPPACTIHKAPGAEQRRGKLARNYEAVKREYSARGGLIRSLSLSLQRTLMSDSVSESDIGFGC